ncbi:MAG: proline dehydrogenase family protein [Prevotellaceae bacterium]|jgi:RHH-type proline utilization regulon transcriptional repressor/proline dehydrogenase/delta 1-pyrroline-5-carboxylate dehydrogenase|nr:proline dehydrogenase family protein [Prevotellaceae bacterium]
MDNIKATEVVEWTKDFLAKTEAEITPAERKNQKKYAIMVQNDNDKMLLSKMLDESSQIRNSRKLSKRVKILLDRYGVPAFFGKSDAFLLKMFSLVGYHFDFVAVPIFKKRLRQETGGVIIDEKASVLNKHLAGRKGQKIGQNVNLLGEVVLGDSEAAHRYKHYIEALASSGINYISVKLSGIYAKINPLNYAQNKKDLVELMSEIYRTAMQNPYIDDDGSQRAKFVNLDMEEYKDTELTLDVFKTVLSQPEFMPLEAGIVVQAYLPDAWNFQSELLEFAKERVKKGGAPLKMRLVKGANLQMETIISALKGWENPVFDSKTKVDANYLRILDRGLLPENAQYLRVGVASHNFFSIGYAYLLSKQNAVEQYVTFEMLEGMANHLPRVMRQLGKQIILYTPVVSDKHFLNAVSYLVRRLDENTGKENFLSYSFNLQVDSEQWNFLRQQFEDALAMKAQLDSSPKRRQNRLQPPEKQQNINVFRNEADTYFDCSENRKWADEIRKRWKKTPTDKPYDIPVQIADNQFVSDKFLNYKDKGQTDDVTVCRVGLMNLEQAKTLLQKSAQDVSGWRKTTLAERHKILAQTADNLANERGNLTGCMAAITGKTFYEGDVEVSEAIDFCRYYPITLQTFENLKDTEISPKGIVLVIPPWNFPLAIPVGGVAAALSGGNSVILKPATSAFPVAWEFAQCFWAAGVPKDALQLICADGREPINYLIKSNLIKHIILTGGTDTAFNLLKNAPRTPLSAETGGKNAIILTASGDRDHAIQNIVTSAFSNAGQKCSACSLLLLDKEIFHDNDFKKKLVDAVSSIQTGSQWDGGTTVGPMITNKSDKLEYALTHLEPGESWLIAPEYVDEQHYILRPCVKWGVKPGSYSFQTELFAPVLSVVCIKDLEEGIKLVESGDYGLTSGLQSLDEREIEKWKDSIEAGNLYINRGITGAIVNRQPFGGMKLSAFGGGIKAGGPNYTSCFVNFRQKTVKSIPVPKSTHLPPLAAMLDERDNAYFQYVTANYINAYKQEFEKEYLTQKIVGERNTLRYLPLKNMVLRLQKADGILDVALAIAAAVVSKAVLTVSIDPTDPKLPALKKALEKSYSLEAESEEHFLFEMCKYDRIRTLTAGLSDSFYAAAAKNGQWIASQIPLSEGRIELLHYLREQSISYEYHRYGSMMED